MNTKGKKSNLGMRESRVLRSELLDTLEGSSEQTLFLTVCKAVDAVAVHHQMNTLYEEAAFSPAFLKLQREMMVEALYSVIEKSDAPKETQYLLMNFYILMTLTSAIERGHGFVQPHVNSHLVEAVSKGGECLSKLGMVMFVAKEGAA